MPTSIPGVGTIGADGKFINGQGAGQTVAEATAQATANVGQAQPGGLQAGTFKVNPDGTLTITTQNTSGPGSALPVGTILGTDGRLYKPDGSPMLQGDGSPVWFDRTAAGAPATANPNFKTNGVTKAVDLGADAITKDNPVAGTIRGGADIVQGNNPANDLVQGTTFGAAGVDANGNIVPGDTTAAVTGPGGILQTTLGGAGSLLGGADLSGLNKASADAQVLEQQFLGQLRGLQPGVAPTMTPAQAAAAQMQAASMGATRMNAVGADAAAAGATPTIGASTMSPAQTAQVAMMSAAGLPASQLQAAQAQAAQMQAAPDVQAARMSPADLIRASQMTAAQLDDARQAQFRTQQSDLANNLSSVIAGKEPSVAELQMRQAFGQQMAQQQGLAAAMGRGGNQALAMRTAMNNTGQLGAQQAAASALLRVQEQAQARGQLGGVLSEARGTDVNVAAQNAANQQGAGQFNATQEQNASSLYAQQVQAANAQNAAQAQAAAVQNQQIQQQAAATNAANQQAALSQTSAQQQQTNVANAANEQAANQFTIAAQNTASATNAGAQNAANTQFSANQQAANSQNSQQAQQVALQNAANAQTVNLANAANQQQALSQTSAQAQAAASQNAQQAQAAAALNAQNQQAASTVNATNAQQTALANAANQQSAAANNQTSALTTTGQDISRQQVVGNQTLQANQNDVNAQVGAIAAQNQKTQQAMNLLSTGLGAIATLSDRRAKKDIEDVSPEDMNEFYRAARPQSWKYKGSAQKRVGPMAQDIEKSAVGKTMIRETPAGKAIDIPSATTAMLAAIADMGRRIERIEARR